MISRRDKIEQCYRENDVRGAFEFLFWRASTIADVPEKTVDFWADLRLCLNRAISELCSARSDL